MDANRKNKINKNNDITALQTNVNQKSQKNEKSCSQNKEFSLHFIIIII